MTESTNTKTGKIRRLVSERGFGFIQPDTSPDGTGSAVFFHRSVCASFESLAENDAVTYTEEASPKGPRASTVSPL